MGHKLICLKCRKSFSIGTDYFKYQHLEMEGGQFISYPDTIKEAVEFVRKYSKRSK